MKDAKTQVTDVAELELLTAGSVWINEAGKKSRYLFTANAHLPVKHQKQFPPVAIYADEDGNVYAVDVPHFTGRRTFHNVDPDLEARLENLFATDGEDGDEEEFDLSDDAPIVADDEILTVGGDDEVEPETQVTAGTSSVALSPENMISDINPPPSPVTFAVDDESLAQVIPIDILTGAVRAYQQLPNVTDGTIMHLITVEAQNGITREKLHACFSIANQGKGITAVYSPKIVTADGELDLNWETFPGVYPCMYYGESMYQVVFTTGAALSYTAAAPDEDSVEFQASTDSNGETVIEPAAPVTTAQEVPAAVQVVELTQPATQHVVVTHVNNIPVATTEQ